MFRTKFVAKKVVPSTRLGGKVLYSRTGRRWQYGARASHAAYL